MENVSLEDKVISIIDQIRPYLVQDGGDIEFVELTPDNVVKVKLQGACGTCPHAKMTLKTVWNRRSSTISPKSTTSKTLSSASNP